MINLKLTFEAFSFLLTQTGGGLGFYTLRDNTTNVDSCCFINLAPGFVFKFSDVVTEENFLALDPNTKIKVNDIYLFKVQ